VVEATGSRCILLALASARTSRSPSRLRPAFARGERTGGLHVRRARSCRSSLAAGTRARRGALGL